MKMTKAQANGFIEVEARIFQKYEGVNALRQAKAQERARKVALDNKVPVLEWAR